MAIPIQMPSLSPTMTEGKIVKWLKKVGDKVSSGEALAEVETDKSNLEIEAYDDGYVLQILVEANQTAAVGAPIAYIGKQGEKVAGGGAAPAPQAAAAPAPAPKVEAPAPVAAPAASGGGRIAIQMPSLSPTMTEGKIVKWLKKVGDKVSSGEALAEVETDKSNLEIEAYDDGTLAEIVVGANQSAPVGSPIAYIAAKGGKAAAAAAAPAPVARPAEVAAAPKPQATPAPAPVAPAQAEGRRVRASPLAKKIARDRGVDITRVQGSGPSGRVVKRDIEEALARGVTAPAPSAPTAPVARKAPAAVAARAESRTEPLTSMRKVIAQRMTEVKPGVPHFYLTIEVEMDAAVKVREEAKALDLKVSVNDLVVKAVAMAVKRYPKINVSLQGDQVVHHGSVDVGVAVALEQGLITPVVRDADQKGLQAISTEVRELAERARKRALKPDEYTGGSITVSNLGMYGIDQFVAIINPPQASILAVGAVSDKVVVRDGQMVIRKMMTATLSCDHRIIDGAIGAEFMRELRGLLEHPTRLLF
ncbi:pyruvate dehydrogenase complex, E2 component, dihydrolipoamide acetyltransferase [Myxococcus stipitatus DSM 14675]|uniref:Acetyltransferase component of pyruvate dehydrogenase complex n=1 Tax=Myxococcus stipitatus (strain DSM 14675 / JCM 12634 / Mx s8) TaxID=1278073 RepID=L7U950_MYXSD|nr:pyruvate dehydrogenase complex dihydrolipoamide acetyltransferase [Myxococcus stipitatus]AGC44385.1 pyruvate dehydrogenase complex, E2 component, dihydrolipoamide acetyltransferase [Myxococcus stipitatus DSM 14675]